MTTNSSNNKTTNKTSETTPKLEIIMQKIKHIPELKEVIDNQDKAYTYKTYMEKYKKAIEEGFHFEAIVIAYSVIEDRLRSFLYHCGLLKTLHSDSIDNEPAKESLVSILTENKNNNNGRTPQMDINTAKGKIKLIRGILTWAKNNKNAELENGYKKDLRDQIVKKVDIEDMLIILSGLNNWRPFRNGITHALMNKHASTIEENRKKIAENGMIFGQYLASQVKRLKSDDAIRKACNLQNN